MKRYILILVALLFNVTDVLAQEWRGVDGCAPGKIQEYLVSSSEEEIVVDVKVNGFFMEKVMTPKGEQVIISGDDMVSMLETGAPDLPLYKR